MIKQCLSRIFSTFRILLFLFCRQQYQNQKPYLQASLRHQQGVGTTILYVIIFIHMFFFSLSSSLQYPFLGRSPGHPLTLSQHQQPRKNSLLTNGPVRSTKTEFHSRLQRTQNLRKPWKWRDLELGVSCWQRKNLLDHVWTKNTAKLMSRWGRPYR